MNLMFTTRKRSSFLSTIRVGPIATVKPLGSKTYTVKKQGRVLTHHSKMIYISLKSTLTSTRKYSTQEYRQGDALGKEQRKKEMWQAWPAPWMSWALVFCPIYNRHMLKLGG